MARIFARCAAARTVLAVGAVAAVVVAGLVLAAVTPAATARLDVAGDPAAVGAADRRLDARAGPQAPEARALEARRRGHEDAERAALAVADGEAARVAIDRADAALDVAGG